MGPRSRLLHGKDMRRVLSLYLAMRVMRIKLVRTYSEVSASSSYLFAAARQGILRMVELLKHPNESVRQEALNGLSSLMAHRMCYHWFM